MGDILHSLRSGERRRVQTWAGFAVAGYLPSAGTIWDSGILTGFLEIVNHERCYDLRLWEGFGPAVASAHSTADSRVLFLLYLLEHQWKIGKNIYDEVSTRMTSEPISKVRISTSSGPVLFLTTQKG